MALLLPVKHCLMFSIKQRLGIQAAGSIVHDMLPGDVACGVKAGVDVSHQLFSQGTGVAEDAAKEPRTGKVSPELLQVRHPLPGHYGVQSDVGVANIYTFSGQVRICSQAFGDPNVSA